jgi:hypothetical protein
VRVRWGIKILIADITGSVTRLPSSYKIEKNFNNGLLRLNDILLTETSFTPGGRFLQLEQIIDMDIYTLQSLQGLKLNLDSSKVCLLRVL